MNTTTTTATNTPSAIELIGGAFQAASLAWACYYLLDFFGFAYLADIMLIPVAIWTVIAFGSLPIAAIVWIAKHVRITIV